MSGDSCIVFRMIVPQSVLCVPERNVEMLRGLAEVAQVSPERFLEQSIRLGIYVVQFLADRREDEALELAEADEVEETACVLYEQPDKSFLPYRLSFCVPDDESHISEDDAEFMAWSEQSDTPVAFDVNPRLLRLGGRVAEAIGVDANNFVEFSLTLRWHWAVTRQTRGEILIRMGDGDDPIYEITDDGFLDHDSLDVET